MIPDSEGRMKINCSCLESRIGDFAESSQESEGFSKCERAFSLADAKKLNVIQTQAIWFLNYCRIRSDPT